jgi:hypothetical protein
VDRWDTRENQMIAVLTQPTGDVTVTDGTDVNHQVPSFPELQKRVTSMVDSLTGEVAGVKAIANHVTALATSAEQSASEAAASAVDSAASAQHAADSASASTQSATDSATSAAASESSRQTSDARATAATTSAVESAKQATAAAGSASKAAAEADDSAASASTALIALGDAQTARDLSRAWATNVEDQAVVPGEYSARHWAIKAQAFATGSLVYLGAWDASSNTLPTGATKGAFYKITGSGTIGGITYRNGDNIVHNGSGWDLIDNTESVTAVAGKVGNVTLSIEDITSLSNALAGKASVNHRHAIADVEGLQGTLDSKQAALGFSPVNSVNGNVNGSLTVTAGSSPNLNLMVNGNGRGYRALASVDGSNDFGLYFQRLNGSTWDSLMSLGASGTTFYGTANTTGAFSAGGNLIAAGGDLYAGSLAGTYRRFRFDGTVSTNVATAPGNGAQSFTMVTSGQFGGGYAMRDGGNDWVMYQSSGTLIFGWANNNGPVASRFWVGNDGRAYATDYVLSSDATLKERIVRAEARKGISELVNYYTYMWRDTKRVSSGPIAQQVLKVAPEYVTDRGDGKLGVDILHLLFEIVIDLRARIRELEGANGG